MAVLFQQFIFLITIDIYLFQVYTLVITHYITY